MRTSISGLLLIFCLMLYSCSSVKDVSSERVNTPVIVDGNPVEWGGDTKLYESDDVSIGVKNDDNNLYILVKTDDWSAIRKIMGLGMTIWINNDGSKDNKPFGINYPVGRLGGWEITDSVEADNSVSSTEETEMRNRIRKMLREIRIISHNGDSSLAILTDQASGLYNIRAAVNAEPDTFVCEIGIPLKSQFYDIANAKQIGLGLETGEFKRTDLREETQRRGPGGGGGPGHQGANFPGGVNVPGSGTAPGSGAGGIPPGGAGRREHMGNRGGSREPIKIWLDIKLAGK